MIGMAYAPAIVLLSWSGAWELGLRGDVVVVVGLVATLIALIVHVHAVTRCP